MNRNPSIITVLFAKFFIIIRLIPFDSKDHEEVVVMGYGGVIIVPR